MSANDVSSRKRTVTDQTGLDVITKLTEYLKALTTQENISAPLKQKVALTESQQKVQSYVESGQDITNCELNGKKLPCFKGIWIGEVCASFLYKHVESEPWLFFWRSGVVKEFPEQVYKSSAVGCMCCHLANTLDSLIPAWYSVSVNAMAQIVKHRNGDVCKRSRFIVSQNFRTRKIRVFNGSIKNEEEHEIEIPILPFEPYQTTMIQACSIENQIANKSFKFTQISIMVKAVRHCILQGLAQRGSVEDYSLISRKFDEGLDGVGNVHSLCYLLQPSFKPVCANSLILSSSLPVTV